MDHESLRPYEEKMGKDFACIFGYLNDHWSHARARYQEYCIMYMKQDNIKKLNIIGPLLFNDIKRLFWHDMMLSICRLTDPSKTGKYANLTIQRLPVHFKDDSVFSKTLCNNVKIAVSAVETVRNWRDKRISHSDLFLTIQDEDKTEQLIDVNIGMIEDALDKIHCVLNDISMHLFNAHFINSVSYYDGSNVFLSRVNMLLESIEFIEYLMNTVDDSDFEEPGMAAGFMARFIQNPSGEDYNRARDLWMTCRRLKKIRNELANY